MGIPAADIFSEFKSSGLLRTATWVPSAGGAARSFEARLMKGSVSTLPLLGGAEMGIQFVAADAPGIGQDEVVSLEGFATAFRLRERAEGDCSADGTLIAYVVRPVP